MNQIGGAAPATGLQGQNYYVSERIVNAGECEDYIRDAYMLACRLRAEVEKEEPSMPAIDDFSKELHQELLKLKYFEFRVERRKTVGECL